MEGKLIVFEGIDGAGKSSNINLLDLWLTQKGIRVLRTAWKSSDIVKPAIMEGKKHVSLKPKTFSLLHAADFYDRMDKEVIPHLNSGGVVLSDRYVYTAFVRDVARGLDQKWVYNIYKYARKPDLVIYFDTSIETALSRIKRRGDVGYYEAGMDVGVDNDIDESFKKFQSVIKSNYEQLSKQYGFIKIDSNKSFKDIQQKIREEVSKIL